MIKIIQETKKPELLVVTPLLPGHTVSGITKKTIKRNDIPFTWITSEGNQNIPKNYLQGLEWYKTKYGKLPPYLFMLDRDIEAGRGLFDRLHAGLKDSNLNVGFAYASFEYKGVVNMKFPAIPYDINKIIRSNYISSNSLWKSEVVEYVGLVIDDKYKRLLDWAFIIKAYRYGYFGIPTNANFIAHSEENSVSAGSQDDYMIKYQRVFDDFIKPLLMEYNA